jgi:hypothetical protein
MKRVGGLCAAAMGMGLLLWAYPTAAAATQDVIVSSTEAAKDVTVTNVQSHNGTISGVIANRSSEPVRNVQLLVDHVWYWKNEFHPGTSSPGRSEFHTVTGEIPPGGSMPFTFQSEPLPQRADGHFEAKVRVTRFTEVEKRAALSQPASGSTAQRDEHPSTSEAAKTVPGATASSERGWYYW